MAGENKMISAALICDEGLYLTKRFYRADRHCVCNARIAQCVQSELVGTDCC